MVVLLAAISAPAQVRETIHISVVEVPVTVTDRSGNSVRGLTAENFELYDDGRKRPIESFEQIDFASAESVAATSPLNPAARRSFMLLFDLSFSSPSAVARAQRAGRDFVKRMVQRGDRVAVATIDVHLGFRFLTSFTTDRALIAAAIDDPRNFRGVDPLQIAGNFASAVPALSTYGEVEGGSNFASEGPMIDIMRNAGRQDDSYNRTKIDRQMELLTALGKTLRSVSGQKHVVLLSEGFNPRLIQGREPAARPEQLVERLAIERGEIWKADPDDQYGSATSLSLLERMAQMFRRSDVELHAIDIRGLRVDSDVQTGAGRKSNEGLSLLARSTGGQIFDNSNDLNAEFRRVLARHDVVYVLGFRAPTSQPGRFHKLRVRLVNAPGARGSHRTGYYETGGESQVERSLSNAEIVLNDIPQSGLRVAALAAPFPVPGSNWQVPVILEIGGEDLLRDRSDRDAIVEVFIYAFDHEGLVRDAIFQRVRIDVEKVRDSLRRGVKYYGTLSLGPGKYAIRSLVRLVETDAKGYVRSDVVIPGESDVAVTQPLFFDRADGWLMVKGMSRAPGAEYPFFVDAETFIPSAEVSLKKGERRRFAVFVKNALPDEMEWNVQPSARLVSQVRSEDGSKFVFEIAGADGAKSVDVRMRRKGSNDERASSIGIRTTDD